MKKEKVGKGKWERGGKPSWKANRERIQVACYLFGKAYEKVKIKEKRRNLRGQNDREQKIQRNEMKERIVLYKRIWKKELKGGEHFKADIIWGIEKNSDPTYNEREDAREE